MKLVSKHMVRHNCKITSALIESRIFIAFEKYVRSSSFRQNSRFKFVVVFSQLGKS